MPREQFIEKHLTEKTLVVVGQAVVIITEYRRQGFTLTLRQLYYQFVARALLTNTFRNYKRLGSIVKDARLLGLIDWDDIEDRTRNLQSNGHWDTPAAIVEACANQFRHDLWEEQSYRPQVWIEKEALVGVIEPACTELDVSYFACRGYTSVSELWIAGKRLAGYIAAGQTPVIFHLGDHDPSGIDMTRDNLESLGLFSRDDIRVERLALNMDQVRQYNPPPNFAKMTDTRAAAYVALHGDKSWELDALEPTVIDRLVRDAILAIREDDIWDTAEDRQEEAKAQLRKISDRWDDVADFLS